MSDDRPEKTADSLRKARQARVAAAMAEANERTGLFKARAGSNSEVLVTAPGGNMQFMGLWGFFRFCVAAIRSGCLGEMRVRNIGTRRGRIMLAVHVISGMGAPVSFVVLGGSYGAIAGLCCFAISATAAVAGGIQQMRARDLWNRWDRERRAVMRPPKPTLAEIERAKWEAENLADG